jgi:hypothetical protein
MIGKDELIEMASLPTTYVSNQTSEQTQITVEENAPEPSHPTSESACCSRVKCILIAILSVWLIGVGVLSGYLFLSFSKPGEYKKPQVVYIQAPQQLASADPYTQQLDLSLDSLEYSLSRPASL